MDDFIFLNVRSLFDRYVNPSNSWHEVVLALAQTQIDFFAANGLLRPEAPCAQVPVLDAIIRFSDFTPEGQDFLRTGATDKWLAACDGKGSADAYKDPSGLQRRLNKFRRKVG